MPRCVECNCDIIRIVQPETEVVEKCPACGRCCDKYYEFAKVQKWIDIFILERRAWVHVLFNQKDLLSSLLFGALFSCLLESYVVQTTSVYRSMHMNELYAVSSSTVNESLQLVKNIRPEVMPLMRYSTTCPKLFLYACVEYLLSLAVTIWVGKCSQRNNSCQEDVVKTWATSVSLAYTSKLGYMIFLIWRIPIPSVLLVDIIFFIWVMRGFSIAASISSRFFSILALVLCVLTRVIYRHITGWSPQIMF